MTTSLLTLPDAEAQYRRALRDWGTEHDHLLYIEQVGYPYEIDEQQARVEQAEQDFMAAQTRLAVARTGVAA